MGWGEDQAALRLEESCWWTDRLLGTQGPLPILHDDVCRIAPERRHLGLGSQTSSRSGMAWRDFDYPVFSRCPSVSNQAILYLGDVRPALRQPYIRPESRNQEDMVEEPKAKLDIRLLSEFSICTLQNPLPSPSLGSTTSRSMCTVLGDYFQFP